jgi:hypothetical protein
VAPTGSTGALLIAQHVSYGSCTPSQIFGLDLFHVPCIKCGISGPTPDDRPDNHSGSKNPFSLTTHTVVDVSSSLDAVHGSPDYAAGRTCALLRHRCRSPSEADKPAADSTTPAEAPSRPQETDPGKSSVSSEPVSGKACPQHHTFPPMHAFSFSRRLGSLVVKDVGVYGDLTRLHILSLSRRVSQSWW